MPLRTQVGVAPTSITTTTATFPAAVSAGDLLVGVVRTGTAGALTSVSDSVNGAWTILSAVVNGAGEDFVCYFVNSAAGTPTMTLNFGGSTSPQISFAAFSTVLTASPLDQTGAGSTGASGTALTGDSVTTTHANEIVIGFFSQGATETFSQSGSWSIVSGNGTPTARSVIVYQEVTSTGTYQPAVTSNASAAWIGQTLSFQEAGGATTAYRNATARIRAAALAFRDATSRVRVGARNYRDATTRIRAAARSFGDAAVRVRVSGGQVFRDSPIRVRVAIGSDQVSRAGARVTTTVDADFLVFTVAGAGGRATMSVDVSAVRDARIRIRSAVRAFRDATVRIRTAATGYRDAVVRVRVGARSYRDSALRVVVTLAGLAYRDAGLRVRAAARNVRDASVRLGVGVRNNRDAALRVRSALANFSDATLRTRVAGRQYRDATLRTRTAARSSRDAGIRVVMGFTGNYRFAAMRIVVDVPAGPTVGSGRHTISDRALFVHSVGDMVGVGS